MNLGKYKVKWKHDIAGGFTVCKIFEGESLSFMGMAIKHPQDQFCRATGRKISLVKALEISELSKSEKRIIWRDYFSQVKGNINII
jgi:hypothetical protein